MKSNIYSLDGKQSGEMELPSQFDEPVREELIRIPRRPTVLLDLARPTQPQPLWQLFPAPVRAQRRPELYALR